jgi:hypothetical protein
MVCQFSTGGVQQIEITAIAPETASGITRSALSGLSVHYLLPCYALPTSGS